MYAVLDEFTGIALPSFASSNFVVPVAEKRSANPETVAGSTAVIVTSPDSTVSISLPVVSNL